jgi:hydrogenase maturation protein HypF
METLRQQTQLSTVVLSGGCMQNKLLFETLVERLERHRFTVLAGEQVPMNDGGIALGQAFIGGAPPCV